jgi:hypothetical protein
MTCSELAATWLTAIGTLATAIIAVVIALYQEKWRRARYHPTLEVIANIAPPDCLKIPMRFLNTQTGQNDEAVSYFLRIKVKNTGTEAARNVEIYAKALVRVQGTARVSIPEFPPMNLVWSNSHHTYFPLLTPDTERLCDIAHIIDPEKRNAVPYEEPPFPLSSHQTALSFDLNIKPLTRAYILGPGIYSLAIEVSAENAEAIRQNLTIELDGRWSESENTMLGQLVKMRLE